MPESTPDETARPTGAIRQTGQRRNARRRAAAIIMMITAAMGNPCVP